MRLQAPPKVPDIYVDLDTGNNYSIYQEILVDESGDWVGRMIQPKGGIVKEQFTGSVKLDTSGATSRERLINTRAAAAKAAHAKFAGAAKKYVIELEE